MVRHLSRLSSLRRSFFLRTIRPQVSDKQPIDRSSNLNENNYKKLTWLSKATPNTVFVCVKVRVFSSTKVIFYPDNSLDIFRCTLTEVIEPKVCLARLKGIEP